ncbi:MAG: aromatic ring-hydroxylating dioxygenase subunit alpha [Actinobacteria bacterium]|nr:aromatic ring-hydroxylating dioxygenase subunit alpha [Actinomycetota bacterium]
MVNQDGPAPVPAGDLAAALAPFGQSRMLPREAYVDPEVFAWEQRNIFSGWTCVGHAGDLGTVGAQRAIGSGPNGILLVRAEDRIRAFANSCRHRGHELLACGAAAKGRSIVCPYHSWSYRLDGTLRNAPGFRDADDFDPGEFGLAELRLVDWHGWLFVDPSGTDVEFGEHVAGLEEVVGPYRPEDLTIVARHSYELATNWKVIAENYQECYHCSSIHPELTRISPPTSGENLEFEGSWMGGWMSIIDGAETMSLSGKSGGVAIQGLSEHELRSVMYLVGYPNLLVSLHPDYVMTHLMTPLGVDRTHVECAWAFPKDVAAKDDFDPSYAVDFWDLTNRQDWAACESVQRGLSSPHARPGPLAPDEDGVYQFVSRVAKAYAGR